MLTCKWVVGAIIGFPFSGDAETKLKAFNVARYGAKWEDMLTEAAPFFLGAEASIGDIGGGLLA